MKTLFTSILLCFFMDISGQVSANAGPDREICLMDTLKITGSGLNPGDTGSYLWKDLINNTTISNNAFFSLKITAINPKTYGLTVSRITNGNTYYAYDTVKVTVNALPAFIFKGIPPRCYSEGAIQLTWNNIVTARSGDGTVSDTNVYYFQRYKKPSWINSSSPYVYDFPKYISNAQVPLAGLRDTVCYDYTDYKGCYNKECKPVRINPNPVTETKNGVFCQRAGKVVLDKLVMKPFSKVGGIGSFRCLSVPQNSGVNPNTVISINTGVVPNTSELDPGREDEPAKTGNYVIEYCFKDGVTGCQTCDTSTVNIIGANQIPVLKFSSIPPQCINGPLLVLDSFLTDDSTGKRLPGSTWKTIEFNGSRDMSNPAISNKILNSIQSQKYFDPSAGTGQYVVKVTDVSSGCPVTDSFDIQVNGLPIVQITLPDTVCSNDSAFQLQNIQPAGSVGTWSGTGVSGRNFIPSTFVLGSFMNFSSITFTYTNPVTGCTNFDSKVIRVQNPPSFNINASPRQNVHYRVDFNLSGLNNTDTLNGKFLWNFGSSASTSPNPKNVFFADSGTHTVYVTADYGACQVVKSVTFTLNYRTVSITDPGRLIVLHPNPVHDVLNIEMPFDAELKLFGPDGRYISSVQHKANELTLFKLDGLTPGMYLLSVKHPGGLTWKKILAE